jgi:hypothetical protein
MPLTPVQRPGIETSAGVTFGAMNEGTSVRVVVLREVLRTIADASADKATLIAKFDRYRRHFEAIASEKFDRGEKSPIRITRADVIKFAAERRTDEPST